MCGWVVALLCGVTSRAAPSSAVQTAFGQWLPAFLNFTRANGLPVDFISSHAYPTQVDNGLDLNAIELLVSQIRQQIPAAMPLSISEYNSGLYPFFFDNNDAAFAAAFVVRNLPMLQQYNVREWLKSRRHLPACATCFIQSFVAKEWHSAIECV